MFDCPVERQKLASALLYTDTFPAQVVKLAAVSLDAGICNLHSKSHP